MKAIILPDYNANVIRAMKSLNVEDIDIPKPSDKQVLIKVTAAPCNPSDIAFMRGGYNIRKPVPAVMGFECTGIVVETGEAPDAKKLLGKRVSCFSQANDSGTWAEYFVTDFRNCLLISDSLDEEQAAAFCINPFTAYALFQMALEKNTGAIIQNGASGQIGQFIRKLGRKNALPVINLIRKEEHLKTLEREGEKLVLNMSHPDFAADLEKAARKHDARIAFDAVAGDISGMILNAMPAGSDLIIYGGLAGKPVGSVNPMDIIFQDKTIRGFNLNDWKEKAGEKRFQAVSQELQEMFAARLLQTRIQGNFTPDEVQQAMEQYIRNMSSGKILFRF